MIGVLRSKEEGGDGEGCSDELQPGPKSSRAIRSGAADSVRLASNEGTGSCLEIQRLVYGCTASNISLGTRTGMR